MEPYIIEHDVQVMYINASAFPEGVLAAHQQLHGLLADRSSRQFYGISWLEDGKIIYKAAAEMRFPEEAETYGLETFTIPKGVYSSKLLPRFMDNLQIIGDTFNLLLNDPNLDPNGFCLEMYLGTTDMRAMVKLAANTEP
jgi:hypothetical protein